MNANMIAVVLGAVALVAGALQADPADVLDQQRPPALVIQVVDKGWLPLPGMHVVVTCRDVGKRACRFTETTDVNGNASFDTDRHGYFDVRVPDQGGFKGLAVKIRLFPPPTATSTAHVQLRITQFLKYVNIED